MAVVVVVVEEVGSTHQSLVSRRNGIYSYLAIELRGGHFTSGLLLAMLYSKDYNCYTCILVHLVGH